jgi:HK97 family phage major capsid protein
MADFTDLSEANGWIPEPVATDPIYREAQVSAVEAVARKENMTSRTLSVPRFVANGVSFVAERGTIPLGEGTPDEVVLTAQKFADRYAVSYEDRADGIADVLNAHKREWVSNFHIALDNACLGTVGAANSTTRPFTSVYQAVGAGNRTSLAGALQYEDLVEAIGEMEVSRKGGLVVIAHPAFRMALRNLKDAAGDRVVATDGVLGAGVPSVFGHEVRFSFGAVTNTTFSDSTAAVGGGGAAGAVGNPLLVVAAKNELILGVRSGPESALSEHEQWTTDEIELKMRARRGFVLASADSARVIEQTNA